MPHPLPTIAPPPAFAAEPAPDQLGVWQVYYRRDRLTPWRVVTASSSQTEARQSYHRWRARPGNVVLLKPDGTPLLWRPALGKGVAS